MAASWTIGSEEDGSLHHPAVTAELRESDLGRRCGAARRAPRAFQGIAALTPGPAPRNGAA